MSIRLCCPSRAGRGGQALIGALVLVLFALPLGITFYKYADRSMKSAIQDRRQKTAAQLANNLMTDYMRQMSQDAYNGHYDTDSLSRPQTLYAAGFSTAAFTADESNRTLYIRAEGAYGSEADPKARKVLEALIQFQSDLVQYGTMVNGPFTISASNVT